MATGLAISGLFKPMGGFHENISAPVPDKCNGWFTTILVSRGPASATIFSTCTRTLSNAGLGQPNMSFTATIYLTDWEGVVTGSGISELFKKVAGDHRYEVPPLA